jgi:dynein heavy chain
MPNEQIFIFLLPSFAQERPQLEQQRMDLLESIANDRQMLRDWEDKSLSLLQKTEGIS